MTEPDPERIEHYRRKFEGQIRLTPADTKFLRDVFGVDAVTLTDGETTGTLIGPADKIHEIVRPEAVVDEG